ncbi:MAG TPA: hypothetical protein VE666_05800, partial [Mycobacterium sp.]|nr:hypothetical protein [Mycobacterium sp.]
MAEKFDVTSRLAEGRPAVDNIQAYVWACHALGYANADLTLHASQVHDWYGSEDGLDLQALDADCASLEAAVAATEDALMRQDEGVGALAGAWQGGSADVSRAFLRRHGDASAAAAAAVRTTADALVTLRDNLWHTIDGKVAAAIAADDRAPDDWLAAAQTVTTGAGDRAAASERIDHEVKPFVANDIGTEWLTAMRSAMAAVMQLYDAATAELNAEPDSVFDVPGDLGPSWTPPRDDEAATVPAAATAAAPPVWGATAAPAPAPPAWGATAAPAPAPPMPAPEPAPPMPAPPPVPPADAGMTAPAMAAPPSMPSLGGMPDVGGLSGLGQQLADVVGSLVGSADDALADSPELDDPDLNENLGEMGVDDELDDDKDPDGDDESVDPEGDLEE